MERRVLALVVALLLVTAGVASAATLATIYDIQKLVYPQNTVVEVDTVVVTGIDSSPTTYGFWAQQKSGGPYSGIQVYSGSTSCGGLRVGHVVTIDSVKYLEYPAAVHDSLSGSELIYSPEVWRVVDSMIVPAPKLLQCSDYGMRPYNYATAEQWEGVLIRVSDVIVTGIDPAYPLTSFFFRQNAPSTDTVTMYCRTNKLVSPGPVPPPIGTVLTSITGIGHYENSRYHICPRNADDIVYAGAPPQPHLALAYATSNTGVNAVFDSRVDETPAENINNYYLASDTQILTATLDLVGEQVVSLTTATQTPGTVEELTASGVKSKGGTIMVAPETYAFRGGLTPISMVQEPKGVGNDSSKLVLEQVTVAGIVTADKAPYITHFYVETRPGGPWQGVQIFGGTPAEPTQGDSIIVSGYVGEYYNKTEITGIDYLQVCSSGNSLPGPKLVDPALIKTGSATGESYEGVFVRCDPVFVADTVGFDQFGEWRVADIYGTRDTVLVGHTGDYTYIPKPGKWMNIRGPIDYVYEDYRIEPRTDLDIDTVSVIGVDPGTPAAPAVFALDQNFPNPFNPVTTIMFSLPAKGQADLGIYDVSGRLVKTLYSGVLDQGKHKATWDGRNNTGRAVSSGVYFCKLITKNQVAEMKMVILK